MPSLSQKIESLENFRALSQYIPEVRHRPQDSPMQKIRSFIQNSESEVSLLDLGCGDGRSWEQLKDFSGSLVWHGVDIQDSPEVRSRTLQHENVKTFDGVHLPYPDAYFDIIYSNQVLEHVRYPDDLIAEVARVLKPNGIFLGSVSYLEPFHSYSIFNWTPYGVVTVLAEAGLGEIELYAGVDASQLINRQLLNRTYWLRFIWKCSFFYWWTTLLSVIFRLPPRQSAFLKLIFAGHIAFSSKRPHTHQSRVSED